MKTNPYLNPLHGREVTRWKRPPLLLHGFQPESVRSHLDRTLADHVPGWAEVVAKHEKLPETIRLARESFEAEHTSTEQIGLHGNEQLELQQKQVSVAHSLINGTPANDLLLPALDAQPWLKLPALEKPMNMAVQILVAQASNLVVEHKDLALSALNDELAGLLKRVKQNDQPTPEDVEQWHAIWKTSISIAAQGDYREHQTDSIYGQNNSEIAREETLRFLWTTNPANIPEHVERRMYPNKRDFVSDTASEILPRWPLEVAPFIQWAAKNPDAKVAILTMEQREAQFRKMGQQLDFTPANRRREIEKELAG